ncbi:hypothetical protein RvY_10842 [Ramazzottius varieornatus]|uniref:Ribosomal protein S11 n=1 Tax=Ramazzottius varieornatus TaxID=947166 RepID=A0A1D1VJI2_RAMVA|nr:hypothetical protein RvY_10842 [Ramazzottius varieornatus]
MSRNLLQSLLRLPQTFCRIQVSSFHTAAAYNRRKDMRSLHENVPDEDEGTEGERSMVVSSSLPVFPTLETHTKMTFDGMLYKDIPVIYIKCSQNNTIMTTFDVKTRKILSMLTCGMEGFRNCKKGTNVAGQAVGLSVGKRWVQQGMRTFRVVIRGLGPGRSSSIKGLEMAGINIVSISDTTPAPENGDKPRKARRV